MFERATYLEVSPSPTPPPSKESRPAWKGWIAVGLGIVAAAGMYAGVFVVPRQVAFMYAGKTCADEFVPLPMLQRGTDTEAFRIHLDRGMNFGGVQLWSSRVCFEPATAPSQSVVTAATAPFGVWGVRRHYEIVIGKRPHVLAATTPAKALGQSVDLDLNQPDTTYRYYLTTPDQTMVHEACSLTVSSLHCGLDKLDLKQGNTYNLAVQRSFAGKDMTPAGTVAVTILPAVKVTDSSIKPATTLFDKPRQMTVTFDKEISKVEATLTDMAVHTAISGNVATISWDTDLTRQKSFHFKISSVIGTDGSSLEAPYEFDFTTSGGPKVTGVSIGEGGVDPNAKIVVTFDQNLASSTNVASIATISGGTATVARVGANQISFALRNLPRCGAFTLTIAGGVGSEAGIVNPTGWSQASRINCRVATKVIGTSVKGRPIYAYYYGTGSTTILFTGGIHGSEGSGSTIMYDWANYLDTNAYKIPADKQVVIVPHVNADGLATNQRYNAHNVNLDRNFPSSDWMRDISIAPGKTIPNGGGTAPLSEPETQALANLTSSLHVRLEISYHSQGALVGANKIADSVSIGSIYAKSVGYTPMFYNPEQVMGYTLTGEYETWMGEKYGIPAILIELPSNSGHYFNRHLNTMWSMVGI